MADSEKSVDTMKDVQQVIGRQDEYVANTEESFHEVNDGIQKSIDGIRTIAAWQEYHRFHKASWTCRSVRK